MRFGWAGTRLSCVGTQGEELLGRRCLRGRTDADADAEAAAEVGNEGAGDQTRIPLHKDVGYAPGRSKQSTATKASAHRSCEKSCDLSASEAARRWISQAEKPGVQMRVSSFLFCLFLVFNLEFWWCNDRLTWT